jgi:hypothetical protein
VTKGQLRREGIEAHTGGKSNMILFERGWIKRVTKLCKKDKQDTKSCVVFF